MYCKTTELNCCVYYKHSGLCVHGGDTTGFCEWASLEKPIDNKLKELVKFLISNIGHPVGMGIEPTDKQVEKIIELVRRYDAQEESDGS